MDSRAYSSSSAVMREVDKILSKQGGLTDYEYYVLLRHLRQDDRNLSSLIYRKLVQGAVDLDCFTCISRELIDNLKNLDWVCGVCENIVVHQSA